MNPTDLIPAAFLAALLLPASAGAQPVNVADGVLVDGAGMTIYTYDKDVAGSGRSACNDKCAKLWPPVPLTVDRIASPYSIVTRDDGSRQLAYRGKPLYVYTKDARPGERKGDKMKGVWHLVTN